MLLINRIRSLSTTASSSIVIIDEKASFSQAGKGVPSWIGLEYMGQTAAMIAGFQIREGLIEPHLGFLIGSRQYNAVQDFFKLGTRLLVSCREVALVGDNLATFNCTIEDLASNKLLAEANLSVVRKSHPHSAENKNV
jgi:predicted hotdog family 3-hydroxylacyl-ACP dehydratase